MRKFALGLFLACLCLGMTGCGGCGGGLSEASMRARSRTRAADELESAEQPLADAPAPQENLREKTRPSRKAKTGSETESQVAKPASARNPSRRVVEDDVASPAEVSNRPEVGLKGVGQPKPSSRALPTASTAPAPPKFAPVREHLAAPIPEQPLPEKGEVTVVVTPAQAGEPLSDQDCRMRTIENLRRIGAALTDYVQKYGALPPQAIQNQAGQRTLSWRVAILPQLGYDALYRQFRLHEPWDSPHNSQLVAQIPPELQSPERRDSATSYLAVVGPDSALGGVRGTHPESFEDGAENTLLVIEADKDSAVLWTQPSDFAPKSAEPGLGLGKSHQDGTIALAADGSVWRIPLQLPAHVVAALLTTDRGESVAAAAVLKEPMLDIGAGAESSAAADPLATLLPGQSEVDTPEAARPQSVAIRGTPVSNGAPRLPVPDEASLAKSLELLKTLYRAEAEEARKPDQREKVVGKLMAEAAKVQDHPSDYYELLRIVREMAVSIGDSTTALKAVDLVEQKFDVDTVTLRLGVLENLAKTVRASKGAQSKVATLVKQAKALVELAVERDDFDQAQRAHELWLAFARIQGDRDEIQAATQAKSGVETGRKAYAAVPDALKKLAADSNDALANEAVGRYLCLVKGHWSEGLPLLQRGADVNLRVVATIDLDPSRSAQQTNSLADKYWEMADDFRHPQTRNLHMRAIHCYQQAATQLAGGFEKVKAQKRLEEAKQLYGAEAVTKALQQMAPQTGVPVAALPSDE
jgi:hypothetical protein